MTPEATDFRTGVIHPIECVKEAWQAIKPDYWILFAVLLVGALIGAFSLYVLIGPMICGIMRCYLRRIDGRSVRFDDLWQGFGLFWASLPTVLLVVVPMVVWMFVLVFSIYLPIFMSAVMGDRVSGEELLGSMAVVIAVDLIIAITMICLHTLLMFSFPLIVDRGLSGFRPIPLSAKAVLRNLSGVCGLIGVNFLLVLAGELACGVGLYLVMPLIMATNLVAYRKVFPVLTPAGLNPSTTNA